MQRGKAARDRFDLHATVVGMQTGGPQTRQQIGLAGGMLFPFPLSPHSRLRIPT